MADFIDKPRASCALGGALAAIAALPDVIPIIHTSMGCGGNLMNAISFGAGYLGASTCSNNQAPSSAVTETEVVFGGVDRLHEEIASTLKLIDGKLYVVVTGCMTEMIGDDAAGTVNEFADEYPILAVSTPSFKGDSYNGVEILFEGIFNSWLPKNDKKDARTINVFGFVPAYDPFFRGDLEEIERLGTALGLRVNTFFSPSQTFDNILAANEAALNVVLSRTRYGGFAEKFRERHGTPFWITDLPIGPEATDAFLRELSAKLKLDSDKTEAVIERENAWYYRYFERTADAYMDGELRSYAVTATNSNYAVPLNRFLYNELGWVGLDAYVTDDLTDEQREAVRAAFDVPANLIFEQSTIKIARSVNLNHYENRGERYFDNKQPLFIVGSTLEKQFAVKKGAKFLSVSFPAYDRAIVTQGYAGYRGGLRLYEDLIGQYMGVKA